MKKLSVLIMSIIMSIALIGCGKTNFPVTLDDIKDASEVLKDIAVVSELKEAKSLSENGQQVYLKMENEQPINSFKIRGAFYMISKLTPKQLEKGLCTCSAGNHAQGVGLASGIAVAAKAINPDCRIFVVEPENAASMKASIEAGKPVEIASANTITAEGAGALSTAAVMAGKIPSDCKKVVCVVSGANIDPELLEEIMNEVNGK